MLLEAWRKAYTWYKRHKTYKKYGLRTKYHLIGERFDIGEYTYGIPMIHIYDDTAKLKIGKFCSLANGIEIVLGGNHHIDWCSTFSFYEANEFLPIWRNLNLPRSRKRGDVIIGNDVWIGRNVLLLSGARVGDGAVIGAGAVVAGEIPPYAIAVGNPAKVIRFRLSPPICEKMLRVRWWDWPETKIKDNLHLICSSNIDLFMKSNSISLDD